MRQDILTRILIIFMVILVTGGWTLYRWKTDPLGPINLGLDLRGGLHIRLECKNPEGRALSDDDVAGVINVMRRRLDPKGVKEVAIQKQGTKWINIEIPGERNPERVEKLIGKIALLEFVDTRGETLKDGAKITNQKTILTGGELKIATPDFDQLGKPSVHFELKKKGARIFGQFTTRNVGKYLGIALDKKIISCPKINEGIFGGKVQISGSFTMEEVQDMVAMLNGGSLPVPVKIVEKRSIGPTLGASSIYYSKIAACVGLGAALLFMLLCYKLPGFLADMALFLYIITVFGIMSMFNATLTLPGIAGFILSIGMAIDANIIIFERLKEELRLGKTLKAAIDAGFTRAFTAILDSNVTTLIAASVLYFFGTGPIRGFAVTLSIGVLVSMFSAIIVTKVLLLIIVEQKWAQSLSLYGIRSTS